MPYMGRVHLRVKSNAILEAKDKGWIEISVEDSEEFRREIMNLGFVQESLIQARIEAIKESYED